MMEITNEMKLHVVERQTLKSLNVPISTHTVRPHSPSLYRLTEKCSPMELALSFTSKLAITVKLVLSGWHFALHCHIWRAHHVSTVGVYGNALKTKT